MAFIDQPEHIKRFAGLSIRAQLIFVAAGMKSRVRVTDILSCVTKMHIGRAYKRGQVNLAIQDLGALYKEIV